MVIIGRTRKGYLITAAKEEITEILTSIMGECPGDINVRIGQEIPYTTIIRKAAQLHTKLDNVNRKVKELYAAAIDDIDL